MSKVIGVFSKNTQEQVRTQLTECRKWIEKEWKEK